MRFYLAGALRRRGLGSVTMVMRMAVIMTLLMGMCVAVAMPVRMAMCVFMRMFLAFRLVCRHGLRRRL